MSDFERRLEDLGERARAETARSLAPRPDALRRIRSRRSAIAAAAAACVLVAGGGGAYTTARLLADGEPARPAERTTVEQVDSGGCGLPFDFRPTFVPDGFVRRAFPGPGGQPPEAGGAVGHFRDTDEPRFIDVFDGPSGYAITGRRTIRVLDENATLGNVHEGYGVAFEHAGCSYSLLGYGIERVGLRGFAEGLEPRRDGGEPVRSFGAVWPEDTLAAAEAACAAAGSDAPLRRDPAAIATKFARTVLGWDDPVATIAEQEARTAKIEVGRGEGREGSGIRTYVLDMSPGVSGRPCWSVTSVLGLHYRGGESLGISVRGRRVEMAFDARGAASATIEVGYGGRTTSATWRLGESNVVKLDLGFYPETTGHYLVLFRNESGEVFSAAGGPLPAGDFAAG